MNYEIFGIGFNELSNVNDLFNEVYNDGETAIYESKETFHHEDDDDLDFYYRYVIECIYCEGKRFYQLSLSVLPTSCSKEFIDRMVESSGVDSAEELTPMDMSWYGGSMVMFGTCSEESDYDSELNKDILDKIASVFGTMDRFRGFYIDKPWNMIGTTGWDTLRHCVCGEELFKF